ncbi:MAG: cytochrome c oxidase assembly protein [Pseudoclavibacter sp.]
MSNSRHDADEATTPGRARRASGASKPRTKPRVGRWSEADVRRVALAPAGFIAAGLVALVVGLGIGGGATPLAVSDPGPIVMWGLPVMKLLFNVAAAVTIGALVMATWVVSRDEPEFERTMTIAQGGASAWLATALGTAFLTFMQISNVPLSFDAAFGDQLIFFFTQLEIGTLMVLQLAMVLVISLVVFAVRSSWGVAVTMALSLLALWPLAAQGHAAGAADHELYVGGMTLHLTGAAVWLGGLIVIAILAPVIGGVRRLALVERYSSLALISFIAVAASGLVTSIVNVGTWSGLTTPYGLLVLLKAAALVGLGIFGAAQRKGLIGRMRAGGGRKPLAWLIALELALMGVASGLAAALGRTPSVVSDTPASELAGTTPAEILAGVPLPPEFEPLRLLTEWSLEPMWTMIALLGAFFYAAGVRRLHQRGDKWPVLRTVSFMVAVAILLYLVNGALFVYGRFMFSFHMTEHMVLSMIIPIFLVVSAPMTLLLRAVRPRKDGSTGTREWALLVVHSKWAKFFANPIVAAVLFGGSLLVFYFTPLFRWAVTDHVGHMWMIADFLIVGYVFVTSLIGDEPGIKRAPYPMRLIVLVLVMTFHAFFGIAVMTGTGLLVADWFGATGRTWGADAIGDQQLGGAIAWGLGEFPTVILALLVTAWWLRDDRKEQKRRDRRVARDGDVDVELEAYNARLKALADRDEAAK